MVCLVKVCNATKKNREKNRGEALPRIAITIMTLGNTLCAIANLVHFFPRFGSVWFLFDPSQVAATFDARRGCGGHRIHTRHATERLSNGSWRFSLEGQETKRRKEKIKSRLGAPSDQLSVASLTCHCLLIVVSLLGFSIRFLLNLTDRRSKLFGQISSQFIIENKVDHMSLYIQTKRDSHLRVAVSCLSNNSIGREQMNAVDKEAKRRSIDSTIAF